MSRPIQYTIRNMPEPVNRYLRTKARLTGKSLNQVIIDELSEKVANPDDTIGIAFDWFIGIGMDDATLAALAEDEAEQKRLAARELGMHDTRY